MNHVEDILVDIEQTPLLDYSFSFLAFPQFLNVMLEQLQLLEMLNFGVIVFQINFTSELFCIILLLAVLVVSQWHIS